MAARSKSGMQVLAFLQLPPCTKLTSCPLTATLELKAEKANAHLDYINSVAFSPDGKTIVSCSDDQTIKVWDAGARFSQLPPA